MKDPKGFITYEGSWKDNVKHGKGTQIDPNGLIYAGDFENDKKHGSGVLIDKLTKQETPCKWVNGVQVDLGYSGRQ